jgi:hypothetical protein
MAGSISKKRSRVQGSEVQCLWTRMQGTGFKGLRIKKKDRIPSIPEYLNS